MKLSARNQFAGTVTKVTDGAVAELGLAAGMDALAVIKATSVMVGID